MGHQEEGIEDQIITTNANDSDTNTLVPSHSEQVNDFFKHLCEIQVKMKISQNGKFCRKYMIFLVLRR